MTTTRSRTRRWPASWPSTAPSAGRSRKRVWAPLGEKDYSSYISQIPKDIDGLYVGIGGSGLISFVKQYEQQRGKLDTEEDGQRVLGRPARAQGGRLVADRRDDGGHDRRRPDDPEVKAYLERPASPRRRDRRRRALGVHLRLLHGRAGADQGPEAVDGDVCDQKKLQAALAKVTLSGDEAPWGDGSTRTARRSATSSSSGS